MMPDLDVYGLGIAVGLVGIVGEKLGWLVLIAYCALKLGLVHLPS